jgi:hypothetical protein
MEVQKWILLQGVKMQSGSVIGCKNCTIKAQNNAPEECPIRCIQETKWILKHDSDNMSYHLANYINKGYSEIKIIICDCKSGVAKVDIAKVFKLNPYKEVLYEHANQSNGSYKNSANM